MVIHCKKEPKEFIRILKWKAEKKHLCAETAGDKVVLSLISGKFARGEDAVPVIFQGKLKSCDDGCILSGRISCRFYLYFMEIMAALLIVSRFVWSVLQGEKSNMFLCGIAAILLLIVVAVVQVKSKPAKTILKEFLTNLTD